MAHTVRRWLLAGASTLALAAAGSSAPGGATPAAYPAPRPAVAGYTQLTTGQTPPSQAQCASAGRRCFGPQAIRASYDVGPLYSAGCDGRGHTIAIVDSYGSDTMAHDLHVFDSAFGLAPMCGEEGVGCAPGMPTFGELHLQGAPATTAPPPTGKGTGQEDRSAWALEVALDVETAHAMAPGANIGTHAAIFEAVHGSAPDIAGKNVADPCALLLAAAEMLDHLHMVDKATRVRNAIRATLEAHDRVTPDLGGNGTTESFADALAERVRG